MNPCMLLGLNIMIISLSNEYPNHDCKSFKVFLRYPLQNTLYTLGKYAYLHFCLHRS